MSGQFVTERQPAGVGTRRLRPAVSVAKAYLKLAPAFPPRHWTAPKALERARIEYDDEIAGGFLKWFPRINFVGMTVFDIGSGYGGRSARYRELGAYKVVGLEIFPRMVEEARAFAEHKGLTNIEFHVGGGGALALCGRLLRHHHFLRCI